MKNRRESQKEKEAIGGTGGSGEEQQRSISPWRWGTRWRGGGPGATGLQAVIGLQAVPADDGDAAGVAGNLGSDVGGQLAIGFPPPGGSTPD